jgi:lauroyl/myristoyl acyltransferase
VGACLSPGWEQPIKYWTFRIAALLVPWTPLSLARPIANLVGLALWALLPGARRRVDANLRHIPSLAADARARGRAVRGVFRHLTLNYLDFFRGHRLAPDAIVASLHIEGQDELEAALARGRGVILLGTHLGNFEQAASRLGVIGFPVTVPVERLKPERLFKLVCRLRGHHHLRMVPADSTEGLRAMYAALRRGEMVMLAGDRDVLGTGVTVPFFGAPARLPTGIPLVARRSGASVLGAFSWRERRGPARGVFVPIDLGVDCDDQRREGVGDGASGRRLRGEALQRALRPIVAALEVQIAAHPEQWVAALAPIWEDSAPAHAGNRPRQRTFGRRRQ